MSKRNVKSDLSLLQTSIEKYWEILLSGRLLAIDPSCVSTSSSPGYALFTEGTFVEAGYVDVKYHPNLTIRLRRVWQAFYSAFSDTVDVVVIEKPSFAPLFTKVQAKAQSKVFMNLKNIASLQRACGSTIAAFPESTPLIEMSPVSWHNYLKKQGVLLEKSDANDAYAIGLTAIHLASLAKKAKGK